MAGVIKGGGTRVSNALNAFAAKAEETTLRRYRRAVWAVFTRLLDTTPQFSGRAVANWNIGIDAPDLTFNDELGDRDWGANYRADIAREVGDPLWINKAKERNEPRLKLIKSRSKVFITNTSRGDAFRRKDDKRTGNVPYLLDLQSSDRWQDVLRDENQPYETVADVMLKETWRRNFHRNTKNTDEEFFASAVRYRP